MPFSFQHQLISRIIRSGDLNAVLQWGITPDDFTMGQTKGFFTQILAYFSAPETMGSVWGPQLLMQKFANFTACDDPSVTTDALCHEVRKDRIRVESQQLLATAQELLETDPITAISLLQEKSSSLRNECTSKKVDVHISDAMPDVWNDYCRAERGERISVFQWPWEPLQHATQGVRDTDYIILYGRPKSFKSWVLCYIAANIIATDYCAGRECRLLIYSKEMKAEEIFERIGCILAHIAYENWVGNRLTPEERASFLNVMNILTQFRENMTIVCLAAQDVKQGQDTVAWLESKIDRYQPHAVFVDGMYLMSDLSGTKKLHERVANISRSMRQLILRKKIPVIATVQANREAAKNEDSNTEEVAFSDSLGQDATMLIRIVNEWKKGANTLALVMGGTSRRHKLQGLRIYGVPALNFGYYGELSEKEAESALKVDDNTKGNKTQRPITRSKKETDEATQVASEVAGLISHA
jgi:replicative DNA helicase